MPTRISVFAVSALLLSSIGSCREAPRSEPGSGQAGSGLSAEESTPAEPQATATSAEPDRSEPQLLPLDAETRRTLMECVSGALVLHRERPEDRPGLAATACAAVVRDDDCRRAIVSRSGVLATCAAAYCSRLPEPRPAVCRPDTAASMATVLPLALAIVTHDVGDLALPGWVVREYAEIFGEETRADRTQTRLADFLQRLGTVELSDDQRLVLGAAMGLALAFPVTITDSGLDTPP